MLLRYRVVAELNRKPLGQCAQYSGAVLLRHRQGQRHPLWAGVQSVDERVRVVGQTSRRQYMKFIIAGGTGSLGRAVASHRKAMGDEVILLTRNPSEKIDFRQLRWDGHNVGPWAQELEGAVLLNLTGESVDQRPTKRAIGRLMSSRITPIRALLKAAEMHPPIRWLQMSTTAIYGDSGDGIISEGHPIMQGPPQMTDVAVAWENAAGDADRVTSLAILRTGVVLQDGTPALNRLSSMTRWGLGGTVGSGQQWVTWIHISDFLRAIDALTPASEAGATPPGVLASFEGVLHVCAPEPVRNVELMATLRRCLNRPRRSPRTPGWLVKSGSVFLGTDPDLALTGRRCIPTVLLNSKFIFRFATIDEALEDLLRKDPKRPL